jgi:putative exporter of polyketide antibiotics
MLTAFRLELRRGRALVLWIGLLAALYAGGITAFYPTVIENAARFAQMMEVYPRELMAAFGIEGGLGDPGTFLNSYIFQFLWPVAAAIVGILLGTRLAADVDRGFLELPLATRLPRLRYLAATIAAQVVGVAVLAAITVGAIWLVDLVIEPDFIIERVVLAGGHALMLGLAITAVTTFLAVIFLAKLTPDLGWLAQLSAFDYFDVKPLIDDGTYPLADSLTYLAVALGAWVLAALAFRRRDLAA